MVLSLALILCFVVGCQDKEALAELEELKAQATVEKQNTVIFRHFIEQLNIGNTEVFNEIFASDYVYYFPSNTQAPLSLEETQEMVKTHLISFPDYNWTIEELFAVKDRIIARISIAGTFTGDYYGIPATGNKSKSSAILIVRIENGKIVEQRKEQDVLNIMEQLGMELKPKEGEETDF
jgi:predicted ester cyclase